MKTLITVLVACGVWTSNIPVEAAEIANYGVTTVKMYLQTNPNKTRSMPRSPRAIFVAGLEPTARD
jgi:hypothetical protein